MGMTPHASPLPATWPTEPGHHLLIGPPQSGKTTRAIDAFVDFVKANGPDRAVFLTPTRQRAAHLQNIIAHAFGGTTGQLLVRTPASLAFGLLRQGALSRGEPSPTLITGPEQDHVLSELIAGHIQDGAGPAWPAEITPQVLSMRAFRDELRDLLMRAAEAGLDGAALSEAGRRNHRPEWVAAGQLLQEYTAVTALGEITPDRGARYDAATILDRAVAQLLADPHLAAFDAVVHDDYQDATLATSRMLGELARNGAQLLLTSNPDTGVQGFRGGLPALTRTATAPQGSQDGAFGAQVHVLTGVNMRPGLWQKVSLLADDLPPLVGAERRKATALPGPEESTAPLETVTVPSAAGESAFIARRLRELHVLEERPWSQMAVIVRGHHQLVRLRRSLAAAGVPVKVAGAEVPLREEPVVKALLTCLDAATTAAGATIAQVSELLMSSFGGIDALALRRIRRTLRHHDPTRTSAELLLDSMESQELRAAAGNHPGLHRIARMLTAGRDSVREGLGVQMVLWKIWEAAGVAASWQERALTPGPGAGRADADLDAAVALFTVAEQFADRRAGADPRAFIDHLADQDFPADTLAARSDRTEAVALHTAASAVGEHWPIVVVAGVQEDTWPDLRLRDTLLGAADLADLATSRHREGDQAPAHARQEILHDERRVFLAACSRARERLIVTAVLAADARPSMFFDRLTEGPPAVTEVPAPLDLRGLVAALRAQVTQGDQESSHTGAALSLLEALAGRGVPEADPGAWNPTWSGQGALQEAGEKVVLNPSMIEQVLTCPLQWFLTTHGGKVAQTRAQNLGNLIHEIASTNPRGTEAELMAELDSRWHELELPENHIGRLTRSRAEAMVRQLADYLASHDYPAQVEVPFRVDLGAAVLRGQVDRVEHRAEGPHVVDFKTGASRPEANVAERNPQLGAYQLAAERGAFDGPARPGEANSAGASLVFLAVNKNVLVREQLPLREEPEPWAEQMVQEAVEVVSAEPARRWTRGPGWGRSSRWPNTGGAPRNSPARLNSSRPPKNRPG